MPGPQPHLPREEELLHDEQQPNQDSQRTELVSILLRGGVPGKEEILRVKKLVREIEDRGATGTSAPVCAKTFISSYFDLYLGRVTGDPAIEKAALRRCLKSLGVQQLQVVET